MKINHFAEINEKPVEMEGASGCSVRWLVSESDGAPNFAMRRFEVAPGGYTPRHSHPYEHEVYVLEGEGVVYENDRPHPSAQAPWCWSSPTKSTSSATRARPPQIPLPHPQRRRQENRHRRPRVRPVTPGRRTGPPPCDAAKAATTCSHGRNPSTSRAFAE
jgi:hypothetical protein